MTVYVDPSCHPFGRMIMCHMIADTPTELLGMADSIGVARKWIQHVGTYREHFDIAKSKRVLAVEFGAVEISQYELGRMVLARREKEISRNAKEK